jgi:alkaline phosphatase D
MKTIVSTFLFALLITCGAVTHAAPSQSGTARLLQGPMVGAVSPTEAKIWMRVGGEFPVRIRYKESGADGPSRRTDVLTASAENDLIITHTLTGLKPGTEYEYSLSVNGGNDAYINDKMPFTFHTAPAPDAKVKFTMGIGSCQRWQRDQKQPIWNALRELNPDFFVWTGDNIYGDSLLSSVLAEEYRRMRDVESYHWTMRNIPELAIWDDHDFGLNDHDRTNPIKDDALDVFKQYWANPSYGLPDTPGVFFTYSYGGVDFFMVDCRYYRDPNDAEDTPTKTMLGKQQMEWLQRGLKASTAPFKVLISGSGWTKAKGPGGDSWAAYLNERDRLLQYVVDEEIPGVVLISGDTHVGELNAIPFADKGGYDFYDLVSSPLAQGSGDGWKNRFPEARLRSGFQQENVGILTFDMTADVPTLTFNLHGVDGKPAWEPFVIRADQLTNGVESWKALSTYDK